MYPRYINLDRAIKFTDKKGMKFLWINKKKSFLDCIMEHTLITDLIPKGISRFTTRKSLNDLGGK